MNKTGLMAKISIKYVLPTSIWKYFWRILRYFAFLGGISRDFAEISEFRGSATARNIRSPEYDMVCLKKFSIFCGCFLYNKTIIPLALVGYEMIITNSYPMRTCVKY